MTATPRDIGLQCSAKVTPSNDPWGSFHQYQCSRKAIIEEEGKWWCKIHSSSAREERAKKSMQKWEERSKEFRIKYNALTILAAAKAILTTPISPIQDCPADISSEVCICGWHAAREQLATIIREIEEN